MKTLLPLTLAAALLSTAAQAQITISQSNFPATTATVESYQAANLPGLAVPTTGANQAWNYSGAVLAGSVAQGTYIAAPANAAFPTATRAYTYQTAFGPVSVNGVQYQSLNAAGLQNLGFALPLQRINISPLTFGANDSLIIPAQSRVFTDDYVVKFPLTAGSRQVNFSRGVATGLLTVSALSLNRAEMRLVQRITRVDSVAGWGTMRVPAATGNGGTVAIPVIQRRTRFIEVDSVYQGNQPASAFLLLVFGVTQGQVTTGFYDRFYRENSAQPVATFSYTSRSFQTLLGASFSRETNLVASARAALAAQVGGIGAYPNPSPEGELTVALGNGQQQPVQLTVRDLRGRSLRVAAATTGQPSAVLRGLPAGTYLVEVQDRTGATAALKVAVQ